MKLYLSVTFGIIQDSIIGSFVFLEPWCIIYFLPVKVPKPLPRAQTTPKDVGSNLRTTCVSIFSIAVVLEIVARIDVAFPSPISLGIREGLVNI